MSNQPISLACFWGTLEGDNVCLAGPFVGNFYLLAALAKACTAQTQLFPERRTNFGSKKLQPVALSLRIYWLHYMAITRANGH